MTDTIYALVLLDNPQGETPAGDMFIVKGGLEWQEVEWLDPWDCKHQDTMCAGCVDIWSFDYQIQVPEGVDVPWHD